LPAGRGAKGWKQFCEYLGVEPNAILKQMASDTDISDKVLELAYVIRERVHAGIARAKAKGTRTGRPFGRPKADAKLERRIRELATQGMGKLKIARELGIGTSVVQRVLA
jgi:hypothetical protein